MASLQSMAIDVDEVTGGKNARIPQSRKDKLQAELKLLEWHKMANSAAIKGALLQTKATKTADHLMKPPEHTADDEKWIKRVIKQEHIRPLNVSKDFVLEYEKKERENADRLSNQVDRHITTLKTLRAKLESRHDLKARSDEFRHWQKDFLPKKQAVMIDHCRVRGLQVEAQASSRPRPFHRRPADEWSAEGTADLFTGAVHSARQPQSPGRLRAAHRWTGEGEQVRSADGNRTRRCESAIEHRVPQDPCTHGDIIG